MKLEGKIRKLDLLESKEIYYNMLVKDFPACEVKPWEKIEQLTKDGLYESYGLFEGETFFAYAFFSKMRNDNYLLMDYFAVNSEFRGKGYGQYFLAHIREIYPEIQGIVLEVEGVEKAQNEEEREIRTRRIHFYEKAGLKLYPLYAKVYDAHYQLMFFRGTESFPSQEKMTEIYRGMYDVLLGPEKSKKYLELTFGNGE